VVTPRRDLGRTRERLRTAALAEFAAHGFAGARTDLIARRAGVNKRMLFYCFGSKAQLYREVLQAKLAERTVLVERTPEDLPSALRHWSLTAGADRQWVRFLQWEALEQGGTLAAGRPRRALFLRVLERFQRWQDEGRLPPEIDPAQVMLAITALILFPAAFPQFARLITGVRPESKRFQQAQNNFLDWLAARLVTPAPIRPRGLKHEPLQARE
jgi:TetR/AcrR family transcriptional regulator